MPLRTQKNSLLTEHLDPGILATTLVTNANDANKTTGGAYVRRKRVAAGLSLRDVADAIGVSHVFYGEFERGIRATLKKERLLMLEETIPGFSLKEYERSTLSHRPLVIALGDAPPEYQDLGLALARQIDKRTLKQTEIAEILRILQGGGADDE